MIYIKLDKDIMSKRFARTFVWLFKTQQRASRLGPERLGFGEWARKDGAEGEPGWLGSMSLEVKEFEVGFGIEPKWVRYFV